MLHVPRAQGHRIGDSLFEADWVDRCREILASADERDVAVMLPTDVVIAQDLDAGPPTQVVSVDDGIPTDGRSGHRSTDGSGLRPSRADSATVVWNGPMGVFELEPFAAGTRAVAEALAATDGLHRRRRRDSAAAVRLLGIDADAIDHISTGGGASLELLEGKTLPGIAVLEDV